MVDDVSGDMHELLASDGYCIGEFLASIYAFIGLQMWLDEAIGDRARSKACVLSSSDNGVCVGELKEIVMVIRRMIEIGKMEGLSDLQEVKVLRTVSPEFESGPYAGGTTEGRMAIESRVRSELLSAVQDCYDGAPPDPSVYSFFATAEYTTRGVMCLGAPIGQLPYRAEMAQEAADIYVSELHTLRMMRDVSVQEKATHFVWSLQQTWQHWSKTQPASVLLQPAQRVDSANQHFISQLSDYDSVKHPGGPKLSTLQRTVIGLPESECGFGIINHENKVRAGGHTVGIVVAWKLAESTTCQWLIDIVRKGLAKQARPQYKYRREGSVAHSWVEARALRRAAYGKDDNVIPEIIGDAAKGDTPGSVLYGRLMAKVHTRAVSDIHHAAKDPSSLTEVDRRCMAVFEHRRQISKGGFSRLLSIVPTVPELRAPDYAFRMVIGTILGMPPHTMSEGVIGARCICHYKPKIDKYHCQNCPLRGRSAAHNAARDCVARQLQKVAGGGVVVAIEPKGHGVGQPQDRRTGPDVLAIRPSHRSEWGH